MLGCFNIDGIVAPPLPSARLDLTETDMDDWRDAVVHGTGPLGCYVPKFDHDAPYNGIQVEGVWIDEASGDDFFAAYAASKGRATPCIPDTAPAPVIDWMHRPPPPLSMRLFRAGVFLAVVVLAVRVILS